MSTAPVPTVIVIGSAGHTAQRCMAALRDRYRIVGLDVPGTRYSHDADVQIGIDLAHDDGAARSVAAIRALGLTNVVSVLVLATDHDPARRPSPMQGALRAAAFRALVIALSGLRPQQWILLSSMHVHAPSRVGSPINEASALQIEGAPTASLVALEHLLVDWRGEAPVCVLRPAPLYDDGGHSALPAAACARDACNSSARLFDYRDSRERQPLLHVADLIDAIDRAIGRRACLPAVTVLLLAEPEPLSFKGLELSGPVGDDPHLLGLGRGEVRHYEVDVMRARPLLGWAPMHRVADALPLHRRSDCPSAASNADGPPQFVESVAPT